MFANFAGKTSFLLLMVVFVFISGCESSSDSGPAWNLDGTWNSTAFGRIPRFSPDGSTILFGDDTPGNSGLWLMSEGEEPRVAAEDLPPHNWDYGWSPDGSKIAFTSPGVPDDPLSGLWVVTVSTGVAGLVFDRGRDVCWMYDNEHLVLRVDDPLSGEPGLYKVNSSTGEAEFITGNGFRPVCSPISDIIAYQSGEINGVLYTITQGAAPEQVTTTGAIKWVWSGDGSSLFCVVDRYTTGSVRGDLYRIDGATSDSLTSWVVNPSPNSTGELIAFNRIQNSTWDGIWLHGEREMDIKIDSYGLNPNFDPMGDRIAYNSSGGGIRMLVRNE